MKSEPSDSDQPTPVGRHVTLVAVVMLVIGAGIGFVLHGATPNAAPISATAASGPAAVAAAENAGVTDWTCAMHPQIHSDKPGLCPICGMDLIPVNKNSAESSSSRRLAVTPEARALMNVQTVPVERKFVTTDVRLVGKVAYDETLLGYITARVAGRLDRLYVDYTGVAVKKGEHMYSIYSPELYYAQEELIQSVQTARDQGKAEEIGGVSLVSMAREKLRLIGLTDQQISEIEGQDKPTDHVTFYAPMGGIVIEKLRKEGDYVKTGERIYTIADLSHVWVMLDAYESDLVWLRYGQEVTFTTEAYPGEEFVGRIAFIQPVLDDMTRTVKVRVNVANPEGKLKPEMFVRGIVRSQVADGGRVIDPDLAGKWICPMHPEVVKDGPGKCDLCGMELVTAESLGYPADKADEDRPPLVIPKSAALVTGKRAVVYVEVPGADQPTYEGREIVLGPEAGDYYLVTSGLKEGELVVTNGAFKIDSEIQIQARPSMMLPEGAGTPGSDRNHSSDHLPGAAKDP
jgi:membrane fusion protein, copper/silver efflux system